MDNTMNEKKDSYFKCPNCGTQLCAETMDDEKAENEKPPRKMNAGSMPMTSLRSKLQSSPSAPNLNSY